MMSKNLSGPQMLLGKSFLLSWCQVLGSLLKALMSWTTGPHGHFEPTSVCDKLHSSGIFHFRSSQNSHSVLFLFLTIGLAKVANSTAATACLPCCLEISFARLNCHTQSSASHKGRAWTTKCTWNLCYRIHVIWIICQTMTGMVSSSVSKWVLTLFEILGTKPLFFEFLPAMLVSRTLKRLIPELLLIAF